MEKIKVCAYCRVSTDSKDQENSFENQVEYFKNKTHELGNYELVEIYADKGLSATSMDKREDFLRMIEDAGIDVKPQPYKHENKNKVKLVTTLSDREPKFKYILVKNTSRFSRNIEIASLLMELREKKVYVKFLDKAISTENPKDDMFVRMFISVDQRESEEKSERIRFGHKAGMEKGVIMANEKLYGYNKIDKYTLEIVEDEANIIRYIFELYSQGYGARRIINMLDEKGYKTRQGKKFAKSTINRILQNEKYKGVLVRNKYTTGTIFVDKTISPRLRPKEEWLIYGDRTPSIVSKEVWNKCEQIRKGKVNYENQKGKYHGTSDYANKIFCGKCEHTYTKNNDRGRILFNCGTKKTKGTQACNNINISETKLNKVLDALVDGLYYDHIASNIATMRDELEKDLNYYKDRLHKEIDMERIQTLENEIKEIERKESKILDLHLDNAISKDILYKKQQELEENKKSIDEQLKHLNMTQSDLQRNIRKIEEDIEKVYDYQSKIEITKDELLKTEIRSIEIVRANEWLQGGYKYNIEEKTKEQVISSNVDEKDIVTSTKEGGKLAFGGYDEDIKIKEQREKEFKKFYDSIYTKNNIVVLIKFNSLTLGIRVMITNKNNVYLLNDSGAKFII